MRYPINKISNNTLTFLILALLLAGCSGSTIAPTSTPTQTEPVTSPTGLAPTPEPETATPFPTATPASPDLYFQEPLPEDLVGMIDLNEIVISANRNAPLWFGKASAAPEGEILHTADWVYALAAPFPTVTDSVSLDELRAYWQGYHPGRFQSVSQLYLPETLATTFSDQWGPYVASNITIYTSPPEVDALWEQNAWVILPFDRLQPKLKVIQIDAVSPLHKDFVAETYPLTLHYHLVVRSVSDAEISETDLDELADAFPASNRDVDKMTTLVMTGVTALVRATAARMETRGVHYPGEAIRPWLVEADLTHISNEVSFYENCPPPDPQSRSLFFCSSPEYIELLAYVGADIIELTGNHNNDILRRDGKYIVPYNLNLYQKFGLQYFGGGRDIGDARSPLTLTHNGNRLAFIGCNAPGPDFAWATQYRGGAAPCGDYQWMVDEIQALQEDGFLPIATFQYYEDYYNFAESHHLRDFGMIAEAGAVILNGSQAHRPKAMAFMGETLVDFGLGNLFFDQMGYTDMYGNNLQQVRWEKIQRHTFYNGHHISTELLTAMLEDYAQPRPMTPQERQVFLEEIFSASNWNSR